ncbi:CoA-binding protein [bacterium]|nr:MAG: CoA-binding protein [bacterium]RIK64330.1 MAG: CoA-binding protein [Planctomycetota bacterium]
MDMCEILRTSRRIAVLGASPRPDRTAHDIALYLSRHGYEVVPVNPRYEEIQGARCYKTLAEVPQPVDIVDVFRAAEHEDEVAEEILAMKVKPRAVWFQLFAGGEGVRETLEQAGITVFVDQCIKVDHSACS